DRGGVGSVNYSASVITGRILLSQHPARVLGYIASRPEPHYIYVLRRADGTPFYVGKGTGGRCLNQLRDALNTSRLSRKPNIIRQLSEKREELTYELDSFHSVEAQAFSRERQLIA